MDRLDAVITKDGDEKLLINGMEVYPGYCIDWRDLVASLVSAGEYEFFVCTCGEAGCAGLFVPQEIAYEGDTITWKVVEPEPEGPYRFDRDQCLETISEAFTGADAFRKGEWNDFSVGPHGFYLETFTRCLEKLKRWSGLRKQGIPWDSIAVMENSGDVPPADT